MANGSMALARARTALIACALIALTSRIARARAMTPIRAYASASASARTRERATRARVERASDGFERAFAQRVDHFACDDDRTFEQRYFARTFVARGRAREVYVCAGGEGEALSASVVEDDGDAHCADAVALAKARGGVVVALEHRFYGASQPTGDLSVGSLKYLSSAQALEDLATFATTALTSLGASADAKIVVFGGSYPGMLASFFRTKYPHIAHAAVASSAPVRAELDMRGYYDVVGDALREADVGGSDGCFDAVSRGFSAISRELATARGRRGLEEKFNLCGVEPLDAFGGRDAFAMTLQMIFPAQNNDPSCAMTDDSCLNIAKACSTMLAMENKLDAVAALAQLAYRDECVDIDGEESLRDLKNEVPDPAGDGARQWTWQTCTEFAFFQTCERESRCPFKLDPPANTLESYEWLCRELFNIDVHDIAAAVNRTNARYGADVSGGTRILYPSGSVDPWIANSITRSRWLAPAFVVPGASHHAWTHPPKSSDSPAVVDARARIKTQITAWLERERAGALRTS